MASKDGAQVKMYGHILRDAEESAMSHELGSPEYVRCCEISALYQKAKNVRKTIGAFRRPYQMRQSAERHLQNQMPLRIYGITDP